MNAEDFLPFAALSAAADHTKVDKITIHRLWTVFALRVALTPDRRCNLFSDISEPSSDNFAHPTSFRQHLRVRRQTESPRNTRRLQQKQQKGGRRRRRRRRLSEIEQKGLSSLLAAVVHPPASLPPPSPISYSARARADHTLGGLS